MLKRILKTIMISLIALVCLYSIFIIEETIRLKNGGIKPLIIISGTCDGDKTVHLEDYETSCHSIGFTLNRSYILDDQSSEDNRIFMKTKEELWLFDKYLIWGWIS